jgi:enoyl-[acyl-carrier protein] reductase II
MNRVQSLLGVEVPIVQAPMTYIATAELAGAVSGTGGLGVVAASSGPGRRDLQRVRRMTDKPVAANIPLAATSDAAAAIDAVLAAGIGIVTTSAGDPARFAPRLRAEGLTVPHVVDTLRAALKARDAGVDALIVEGVEGGGFKNPRGASTMVLLPLVAS